MLGTAHQDERSLWSIILAGGEGQRIGSTIQGWLGRRLPKQYCVFTGSRSMLQHTVDRADRVSQPDRKITVIDRGHHEEARRQLQHRRGRVVDQPADCDTAAGVFLPLTYVRAQDPTALVVVFPSDHFVYPEQEFIEIVQRAVRAANAVRDKVLLLGVRPEGLEPDYGWIHLGDRIEQGGEFDLHAVKAFLEKPGPTKAKAALAAGALWNTLVMVSRVETLWRLGWRALPAMMQLFDRLEKAVGTEDEEAVLASVYLTMPHRNFSFDVLQPVPSHVAVMEVRGVLWSDWGRPERIVDSLQRIGKQPAFSEARGYGKVG